MKKPKLKTLQKKLDRIFSQYIVKRDNGVCCTCGKKGNQAGHFIGRGHWGARYDERNVHCQDVRCNIFLSGNYITYYEFMEVTYGKETIKELQKQSHWTLLDFVQGNHSFDGSTRDAYEYLLDYYQEKLNAL